MLEAIKLEKTRNNPEVILDKENNHFEISGRSIQEDAAKFYAPLHDWVVEYVKVPNPETTFVFRLEYLNSASIKKILKMMIVFENLLNTQYKVKVVWQYEKNDEIMKERGEEIKSVVRLPFDLIAVDNIEDPN